MAPKEHAASQNQRGGEQSVKIQINSDRERAAAEHSASAFDWAKWVAIPLFSLLLGGGAVVGTTRAKPSEPSTTTVSREEHEQLVGTVHSIEIKNQRFEDDIGYIKTTLDEIKKILTRGR